MGRVVISVRLFAILRERAGRDSVALELAEGATVDDALAALGTQDGLGDALGRMPVGAGIDLNFF